MALSDGLSKGMSSGPELVQPRVHEFKGQGSKKLCGDADHGELARRLLFIELSAILP